MKTGIYGGTFSPPHIGHIAAARAFVSALELDELLIIPALIPPHKELDYPDDPKKRLEMCQLAFGEIDKAEICNIELCRGGKSYTVDTLTELTRDGRELFLLCGTDMIMTLDTWYRPDEIFRLCTPVCIRRETSKNGEKLLRLKIKEYKKKYGVEIPMIDAPTIEISSSELREAVRSGKSISEYVTPSVKAYIEENKLYVV